MGPNASPTPSEAKQLSAASGLALVRVTMGAMFVWVFFETLHRQHSQVAAAQVVRSHQATRQPRQSPALSFCPADGASTRLAISRAVTTAAS